MSSKLGVLALIVVGIAVGLGGLALGAYLGTGNNGWGSAIFFSIVGVIGAPLAAISWTSRRSKRRTIVAGVALGLGVIATMGLFLDLTNEHSQISFAFSQVPWLVAAWLLIWILWISASLARLVMFTPHRTRAHLSSRRGDGGT